MAGTAALVAGWGRHQKSGSMLPANIPGPMNPAGDFPAQGVGDPTYIKVELFVNSAWVDITDYVMYRDTSGRATISRGRADETSQYQPQSCAMELNNRDGRFSPRNPTGPYYGYLGRNTPLRVSRLWNGVRWYRFCGEVPAWPNSADLSGTDVSVQVTAYGQLRRFSQGTPLVTSTLWRAFMLSNLANNLVSYWPCEDVSGSQSLASAFSGQQPMTVVGSPSFAANSSFVSSNALPTISSSIWNGNVAPQSTWTDNCVRFNLAVPSGGDTSGSVVLGYNVTGTPITQVWVVYTTTSNGTLQMYGYNKEGANQFSSGTITGVNGQLLRVSATLRTSGANVIWELETLAQGATTTTLSTGTVTSATVGSVTSVYIDYIANLVGTSVGHVSVQSKKDALTDWVQPMNAYLGEAPDVRFARLCTEQGVQNEITYPTLFTESNPVTMGYQLADTFPNLLQGAIDTDMDFMAEPKDQLGFAMRTRISLYNQPIQLSLDMNSNGMSAWPVPEDDDLYTANDVIVQRTGGSTVRKTLGSGAMSIQAPPVGVGDYQTSETISLGTDGQLNDQAGWRLHLGTNADPRYPSVAVNANNAVYASNTPLMNTLLSADVGTHIAIINPPISMGYDPQYLIVQGYQETIGEWEHNIIFNCSPEQVYTVATCAPPLSTSATMPNGSNFATHADTDGSTLTNAQGAADTVFSFTTSNTNVTTGGFTPWTQNPIDFPFDVNVGGERVTVVGPGSCLQVDPFLANGTTNYSTDDSTISISPSVGAPYSANGYGLNAILVAPIGSPDTFAGVGGSVSAPGTATYSQSFTAWAWVYSGTGRTINLFANWFQNGAYISTSTATGVALTNGTWTLLTAVITAPSSGSAFNEVQFGVEDANTPSTTQTFYVWGLNGCSTSGININATPQTMTVIRSVNGVVVSQTAGAPISMWFTPVCAY